MSKQVITCPKEGRMIKLAPEMYAALDKYYFSDTMPSDVERWWESVSSYVEGWDDDAVD